MLKAHLILVLDASLGKPANDVAVSLEVLAKEGGSFQQLAQGYGIVWFAVSFSCSHPLGVYRVTDGDGRCSNLMSSSTRLDSGTYKMVFQTGVYFAGTNRETFYPVVEASEISLVQPLIADSNGAQIIFVLANPDQHYHIPLLLSPWSYTTYRGS